MVNACLQNQLKAFMDQIIVAVIIQLHNDVKL